MKNNLILKHEFNMNSNIDTNKEKIDNKDFLIITTYSSSKSIKDNNVLCRHLIVSSHFLIGKDIELLNLNLLRERYKFFNKENLNLVIVSKIFDNLEEPNIKTLLHSPWIRVQFLNPKLFFSELNKNFFIHSLLNDNKKEINNFIIIYHNLAWSVILSLFRRNNIIVSGGSHTKRHILSPTEFRLATYLYCLLNETRNSVIKSYHSDTRYEDFSDIKTRASGNFNSKDYLEKLFTVDFNQDDKDENLINNIDNKICNDSLYLNRNKIHKKGYHTSIILYNDTKDITVQPEKINDNKEYNVYNTFLSKIKEIIEDKNYCSEEAQRIIENSWIDLIKDQHEDIDYMKKRYSHKFIQKINHGKETLNILNDGGVMKRKFPKLYKYLNDSKLLLITYGVAVNGVLMKIGYTNLCGIISIKLIHYIFMVHILSNNINIEKQIEDHLQQNKSFKDFVKELDLNDKDLIILGDFFLDILLKYPSDIFERTFEFYDYKNEVARIKFNETNFDLIKANLVVEPASLPMLCEPIKWNNNSYGGYLNNQYLQSDLITGSSYHEHKIKNKDCLYKAINYMSSIQFSFNESLLNYLENEGQFLLEDAILSDSEKYHRYIQLNVAKTYIKVPFFIPLQSDWRGRIYTKSFFANYQGEDLSLALIQFFKGEILTNKGLVNLYIHGANIYNEDNINKSTYEKRIEWIKNNMENILQMNIDFMLKADNKFSFAAFCLLMKELHINPNIEVKLPIFLDATCSGIQHLAALIRDTDLATEVNLNPRKEDLGPADIYETLRNPINEEIRRVGREESLFSNLELVDLNRKIIKTPIMTKTYNVTQRGIQEQLISQFIKDSSNEINNKRINFARIKYKVPSIISGKTINLSLVEINRIAQIIYDTIFKQYPGLNLIYNYFIDMAKLLNKLDLPVIWLTPSGLEITQNYSAFKRTKIGLTLGGRSISLILKEKLNKTDKHKQSSAIIPNIIHSLDASHLSNVIITAFENGSHPIITIHDCFGTHPNKMDKLYEIVKFEFIKTYITESFIDKFHDRNLQSINDYGYPIEKDDVKKVDFIQIKRTKVYIPNKPTLGDFDLNEILRSKYIIT